MKKALSLFLAVLLCIMISAACAEPVSGESGAYVNSWRPSLQRLAFVQGKLYCLTQEKVLWIDYGVLVTISKTSTERVMKKAGLQQIKSYQGNLLLISRGKNLGEMLAKNTGGTEIWEVFDPSTGKTSDLLRYHIDTDPKRYFSGSDKIFYTTHDETFGSLYRKDDQGDVLLNRQTEKMGLDYPSYKALCYGQMEYYDLWTRSYRWQPTQVRVFDYASETVLETNDTISPTNSSIFLEIVLKGRRMYYLSAQGLNVWDFESDTDTNVLPFDSEKYTRFSLSENTVALYGTGRIVDFYDLSTGELTKTVSLSVRPNDVFLTEQEMYVYDRYSSQMEYLNFETNEHAVLIIR